MNMNDWTSHLLYPRVQMDGGWPEETARTTTIAEVGTTFLEWTLLSILTGNSTFYKQSVQGLQTVWRNRNVIGLPYLSLHVPTGQPADKLSGIGPGLDSYLEYMAKGSRLTTSTNMIQAFHTIYAQLQTWSVHDGLPVYNNALYPWKVDTRFHALSAFWPSIQLMADDYEHAIETYRGIHWIWSQSLMLPEEYNYKIEVSVRHTHLLRPELYESTYYMIKALKELDQQKDLIQGRDVCKVPPFEFSGSVSDIQGDLLEATRWFVASMNATTRSKCGFAFVKDVRQLRAPSPPSLADRSDTYVLSETLKYLYLILVPDTVLRKNVPYDMDNGIFTTEGHFIPALHEIPKR
eukprot:GHVO01033475.1.p1 GENE.GHVO01033475.1~~GHVO01033475.1.p1  ORF type:complete len:349 (+),score=45.18 GHVO01033475.1:533-1579(+)